MMRAEPAIRGRLGTWRNWRGSMPRPSSRRLTIPPDSEKRSQAQGEQGEGLRFWHHSSVPPARATTAAGGHFVGQDDDKAVVGEGQLCPWIAGGALLEERGVSVCARPDSIVVGIIEIIGDRNEVRSRHQHCVRDGSDVAVLLERAEKRSVVAPARQE